MAHDKTALPLAATQPKSYVSRRGNTLSLIGALFLVYLLCNTSWSSKVVEKDSAADLCSQVSALTPSKNRNLWEDIGHALETESYGLRAIDWLGGAVRVPTESYDRMGPVGEDPRWEAFAPFHEYLLQAFPLIHTTLKLTKVNTYGLLYAWPGSNSTLKPLLLAAHQDVVPVDPRTVDEWVYPPYSGYYDGDRIWGRGSSDDKSGLIAIMSTIESLLERQFQPSRTVVLAFGFDEETSGLHGAQSLGRALLSAYGEDGFAMLVDEGGGFSEQYGGIFAVPGVAEKGYLDVRVEVSSPGGHSSIPPAHTSIGILSSLLVKFESNPYEAHFARKTPVYEMIQCLAAHAPSLPNKLRKSIKRSAKSDHAMKEVEKTLFKDVFFKSLVGTTQAIDLIQGGVKANALPEQAWAVVDHRIAIDSSVNSVMEHDARLLKSLASDFNLSYTAFGEKVFEDVGPTFGTLTLSDAWGTNLEPAPVAPTSGDNAAPYRLLSGTIKATYDAHRSIEVDEPTIFVAPGIMSGNTDTRYYWKLTKHIFRYNHHNAGNGTALAGVHTINESIKLDSFLEIIRFFTTLILNVDESSAL